MITHFCCGSLGRQGKLGDMRAAFLVVAVFLSTQGLAQQAHSANEGVSLSPSEAMKAARAPFDAARAQPNDLTDADTLALNAGMAQAARSCAALQPQAVQFAQQPPELLSLARLCLFGQQFEPARAVLVSYLALPQPPDREAALLLVQTFLDLKSPGSAAAQEFSLLRDYPFDANIDLSIDTVVGASEAASTELNNSALQLCGKQDEATLPTLESGKALNGADAAVTPEKLFSDAIRCATLDRMSGDIAYIGNLKRLETIAALPAWQGTAQQIPIHEALAQAELATHALPFAAIRGSRLIRDSLLPTTLRLDRDPVLFMPFVLWAPSANSMAHTLALSVPPGQTVFAITSWRANTGNDDVPSPELLQQLKNWQAALPPHISLLIVPDQTLRAFHVAAYPAGIAAGAKQVLYNAPLDSDGSVRLLLLALHAAGTTGAKPSNKNAAH